MGTAASIVSEIPSSIGNFMMAECKPELLSIDSDTYHCITPEFVKSCTVTWYKITGESLDKNAPPPAAVELEKFTADFLNRLKSFPGVFVAFRPKNRKTNACVQVYRLVKYILSVRNTSMSTRRQIRSLGRGHMRIGVMKEHMEIFRDCFVSSISSQLHLNADSKKIKEWVLLLNFVISQMYFEKINFISHCTREVAIDGPSGVLHQSSSTQQLFSSSTDIPIVPPTCPLVPSPRAVAEGEAIAVTDIAEPLCPRHADRGSYMHSHSKDIVCMHGNEVIQIYNGDDGDPDMDRSRSLTIDLRDEFDLTEDDRQALCALTVPVPAYERLRIITLRQINILDSVDECAALDEIVNQVARRFNASFCGLSLVDVNRIWFKSKVGIRANQLPRNISVCTHAILCDKPVFIMSNPTEDTRFANNPLVTNPPYFKFYAGAVVKVRGYPVGSLCIMDVVAREFTPEMLNDLESLGEQCSLLLQYRRVRFLKEKLRKTSQIKIDDRYLSIVENSIGDQ